MVAANDFVENKRSPATRRAYRQVLNHFRSFVGKHPADIREGDIIGYRRHLEMLKRSPSTIVQHLACLSGYYELCMRRELAVNNPARSVERPHVSAYTAATWLSLEQARVFLAQPDLSTVTGKRDYAILIVIVLTGMRRSELCGLKMRHIARSGENIRLRYIAKGGSEVVREIPDRCWEAIEDYLATSGRHLTDESPVFASLSAATKKRRAEKPLTPEAIRQIVVGYARKAFSDSIRVSPHTLRHTAATLLRANGRGLEEIQSFLRHKRIETTRRYLHVVATTDAELSECLWQKLTA
jgi:integrase/recombinase XerC